MTDQRRTMSDSDFRGWLERATPERLDQAAETIQAKAWGMIAAGDDEGGTRLEGVAAGFRQLAEQRRGA